jgi:hypothetical protein
MKKDNDYLIKLDIKQNAKIQDIKKRKRSLDILIDPNMKKKIRKDLKTEQRSSKRSTKNDVKQWIKAQIDNNEE